MDIRNLSAPDRALEVAIAIATAKTLITRSVATCKWSLQRAIGQRSESSEGQKWGVGSVVVEFGVFGAPRFSVQRSQNACFKGFGDHWTENRGAPKTPNSTTTDPTPHSRPSEKRENCDCDRKAIGHQKTAPPADFFAIEVSVISCDR